MNRQKKPAPMPDAANLRAAALRYLARYAAGSGGLRRVLRGRIARAALLHDTLRADTARQEKLRQEIEAIITDFTRRGYIDDAAYAVMKARSGRAAGKSALMLARGLQARGLDKAAVAEALAQVDGEEFAPDYKAALRLAQRRRLGRFRLRHSDDPALKRRDLAALARAGFDGATARRALWDEDGAARQDNVQEED